jgi:hypothetical protein
MYLGAACGDDEVSGAGSMKIEALKKSDIQKMSDLELHEQREQFVQVHEKFWKQDCWPAITKAEFVRKYDALSKEMDKRELIIKPRPIDLTALRKSLTDVSKAEPVPVPEPEIKGRSVRLIKSDSPERIVYGIVAEPDETDTQGDSQTAEDIEKAAYWFMEKAAKIKVETDINHDDDDFSVNLLENYIARSDMILEGEVIKKGTWLQALRLDEETWEQVENGELTGFSMAGTGIRIESE